MAGARLGWLVVLAIGVGGCALGGVERAPRSNGMHRHSVVEIDHLDLEQVEGRIKSVDASAGLVVVESWGEEVDIRIDPATSIFVAGSMGKLSDLEEGAPIRASFVASDPGKLARWIEVPRDDGPPPPVEEAPTPIQTSPAPGVSAPPGGAAP